MWQNRITQFVSTDRNRPLWPVAGAETACCDPVGLTYPAGAFMVPPSAHPQPGIYAVAKAQATFELRRRKRTAFLSLN